MFKHVHIFAILVIGLFLSGTVFGQEVEFSVVDGVSGKSGTYYTNSAVSETEVTATLSSHLNGRGVSQTTDVAVDEVMCTINVTVTWATDPTITIVVNGVEILVVYDNRWNGSVEASAPLSTSGDNTVNTSVNYPVGPRAGDTYSINIDGIGTPENCKPTETIVYVGGKNSNETKSCPDGHGGFAFVGSNDLCPALDYLPFQGNVCVFVGQDLLVGQDATLISEAGDFSTSVEIKKDQTLNPEHPVLVIPPGVAMGNYFLLAGGQTIKFTLTEKDLCIPLHNTTDPETLGYDQECMSVVKFVETTVGSISVATRLADNNLVTEAFPQSQDPNTVDCYKFVYIFNGQVWVAALDGSVRKIVTYDDKPFCATDVDAANNLIGFVDCNGMIHVTGVYMLNGHASNNDWVLNANAVSFAMFPNADYAFIHQNGYIYIANANGKNVAYTGYKADHSLSTSPTGKYLTYVRDGLTYELNIDTGVELLIEDSDGYQIAFDTDPDGSTLALATNGIDLFEAEFLGDNLVIGEQMFPLFSLFFDFPLADWWSHPFVDFNENKLVGRANWAQQMHPNILNN